MKEENKFVLSLFLFAVLNSLIIIMINVLFIMEGFGRYFRLTQMLIAGLIMLITMVYVIDDRFDLKYISSEEFIENGYEGVKEK